MPPEIKSVSIPDGYRVYQTINKNGPNSREELMQIYNQFGNDKVETVPNAYYPDGSPMKDCITVLVKD